MVLIDSDVRKSAFLREAARIVAPAGGPVAVDIRTGRIETEANQTKLGHVDIVSARAVAPLPRLIDLAGPLFSAGTLGLFPKGREADAELAAARLEGHWAFAAELLPSVTDKAARILVVSRVAKA